MKGGEAPVHIMRLAPADVVNDPVIKLQLARKDFESVLFYLLTLFWSHIEGGDVPSNPEALAAVIGMPARVVRRVLPVWTESGKLIADDSLLYNRRVRREINDELAFREEQRARGIEGGRASARKRSVKRSVDQTVNQTVNRPSTDPQARRTPLPAPLPAPSPVGAAHVPPDVRAENSLRSERVRQERALLAAVQGISDRTGEDASTVIRQVTAYKNREGLLIDGRVNPALLSEERLRKSLEDAEAWLADLDKKAAAK